MNSRTWILIVAMATTQTALSANYTMDYDITSTGTAIYRSGNAGALVTAGDTVTVDYYQPTGYQFTGDITFTYGAMFSSSGVAGSDTWQYMLNDIVQSSGSNPSLYACCIDLRVNPNIQGEPSGGLPWNEFKFVWSVTSGSGVLLNNDLPFNESGTLSPLANVPEPASIALMGLGFAGMGYMRRRKDQA